MLRKLSIKNYAIIDNLVLEPDANLNIVTGETGAGKSIILGAISLILGERVDNSVLINKEKKSVIEGYFDVSKNLIFKKTLKELDLDEDDQCIIRREIAVNGKTRAFINDTPVTLPVLNQLTSFLVDLHQQFGHLELEDNNFQLEMLDAVANSIAITENYRKLFYKYKKLKQSLNETLKQQESWQKEADYKQYLYDELQQAALKNDEIEHLEQHLKQLNNAERILSVLQAGKVTLNEGEQPLLNELKRINQQLLSITELVHSIKPIQQRIESVWLELKDIVIELDIEESKVTIDPEVLEQVQQRMDMGYKLLKKHNAKTTNDILKIKQQLEEDLRSSLNISEAIERLIKDEQTVYNNLLSEGEKLSSLRKKAVPQFVKKINELLILVGMPNARFDIKMEPTTPIETGMDTVHFLLDANKSGQFQLLQKSASGGEMSRIMLCIKSVTAKALHMPTLIFDEVDTGISGEAARQVGVLLRDLSQYHQVLCITHQPQVAAKGTRHFYVYKQSEKGGRLSTKIKILEREESILAIARMIGGEQPSEAAINNAKELVG